ncbi:uncharacterized protein LOC129247465 [Anastrepha obliqua]|uniref:uncharacterized protein LOC129247465 n=1 Tax=Anastrepha obliqua TaxID=95512 RepID=UPI0024095C66|nr:uncharacterized protein LOC129247465 [Anastrepha obliqua]
MCKSAFLIALLVIATCHFSTLHAGRPSNSAGRRSYYGGYQPAPPVTTEQPQTPKEYLDKKSGFSTFGIISIIFLIILACLAFYYGIMCYPFLCRDEKKYRFMDVSSTTSATSRSIQSIENFPVDQKH